MEKQSKLSFIEKFKEFLISKRNLWVIVVFVLFMMHNCSQNKHIQNLQNENKNQHLEIVELKQYVEKTEKTTEIKLLESHIEFITEIKEIISNKNSIDLLEEKNKKLQNQIEKLKEKQESNNSH